MVDPMKLSLEDIVKMVREKGQDVKEKVVEEAEDLKKAWFKFIIRSVEKVSDKVDDQAKKLNELEERLKMLEKELENERAKNQESDV
jgi:transposase